MKLLGLFLISIPFLALFFWLLREEGWEAVLFVFGGSAAILLLISVGWFLILGG